MAPLKAGISLYKRTIIPFCEGSLMYFVGNRTLSAKHYMWPWCIQRLRFYYLWFYCLLLKGGYLLRENQRQRPFSGYSGMFFF